MKKRKDKSYKYEEDYERTCYFIYYIDPQTNESKLAAYTTDKLLYKMYMKFHNCKDLKVKSVTDKNKNLIKMTNGRGAQKIQISRIKTRDPKDPYKCMDIDVPITEEESLLVRGNCDNFTTGNMYGYQSIYQILPYLKDEYQEALKNIYLIEVCKKIFGDDYSPKVDDIEIDELMLMIRSEPHLFG